MLDKHAPECETVIPCSVFEKPLVIAVCVLALVGGVGAWWWRARSGPPLSFRTAAVKRGDLVVTINATGTVEPEEVVDVGAQVAGQIISFGRDKNGNTVDYGSIVEEETILAQIDDSVYAADVALARAQLEQDKAGEVSAAANLEQMKAKLVQSRSRLEKNPGTRSFPTAAAFNL